MGHDGAKTMQMHLGGLPGGLEAVRDLLAGVGEGLGDIEERGLQRALEEAPPLAARLVVRISS
jgi:hypothetical protein